LPPRRFAGLSNDITGFKYLEDGLRGGIYQLPIYVFPRLLYIVAAKKLTFAPKKKSTHQKMMSAIQSESKNHKKFQN